MKIAFPTNGNSPGELVNEKFGRADRFIVLDTSPGTFELIENKDSQSLAHGAGTQTAELLIKSGVNVLIAANVGPNALKVLEMANVKVFSVPPDTTVETALNLYNDGKLSLS